jgi:hypothetical protein
MNWIRYRIDCQDWIPDLAEEKGGIESKLLARFGEKLTMAG